MMTPSWHCLSTCGDCDLPQMHGHPTSVLPPLRPPASCPLSRLKSRIVSHLSVGDGQGTQLVPGTRLRDSSLHIDVCYPVRLESPRFLGDARWRLGDSESCRGDQLGLTLVPERKDHGTALLVCGYSRWWPFSVR